jgi:hypothetical protein
MLVPWTSQVPSPARAAEPPDPAARLQVVIKSVYIHDDREGLFSGDGEFELHGHISDLSPYRGLVTMATRKFGGGTRDTITFGPEGLVPGAGDSSHDAEASEALGFAVYAGRRYGLYFFMVEIDPYENNEIMGEVNFYVDTAEPGLGIGTHSLRSRWQGHLGDYTITFEIRRTPLPDLHPTSIEVLSIPGGGETVCLGVENVGQKNAGPFEMVFRIDGQDVPGGTVAAGALPMGQSGKLCLPVALPFGQHKLSVDVDEDRVVAEMNELNNSFARQFFRTVGGGAGTLPPLVADPGAPAQPPDLVVTSVKVARSADGTGTCKGDEINYLFAQVKNVGQGPADEFAVRLEVRGDLKMEKVYIQALAAGAAVDVRFPTDDMNAGPQLVKAIADGDNEVSEKDETNNGLEITATCD